MGASKYYVDELQPLRNKLSELCDAVQQHPCFDERHGELIAAAQSYDITQVVEQLRRVEKPLRYVSPLSNRPEVAPAKEAQKMHREILDIYRSWSLSS